MLKKLLWKLLAKATDIDFGKEYQEALKLNCRAFLETLLFHAYNNTPFYHDVLRKVHVIKEGELCLDSFDKIPILTKDIIRRQVNELVSRDYAKRRWFYTTSGGSTGEPVKLIQDKFFLKWQEVTRKLYYEDIVGIEEFFAKKILFWGARRDIYEKVSEIGKRTIIKSLTNTTVFDCFILTESDMRRFARTINSYKPDIIRGYAGSLYEFCRFVEKRKLPIFSPKIVVSTAEVLDRTMRKRIESVFGAKVYDVYGSREVDGIAGECKHGLLHIFTFNNHVEVLDHYNQKVKEGKKGRVIVTALHNFSMPLVRYEIGDMAVLGPVECKCGNPLPTLKEVIGRQLDYFIREDGKKVYGGYFIHLFRVRDWIKAFKLVQEDYKKLRIMVILRDGSLIENEQKMINKQIKSVMGKDCKLKWDVVDEISKTKTGKYVYAQSLLKE